MNKLISCGVRESKMLLSVTVVSTGFKLSLRQRNI